MTFRIILTNSTPIQLEVVSLTITIVNSTTITINDNFTKYRYQLSLRINLRKNSNVLFLRHLSFLLALLE